MIIDPYKINNKVYDKTDENCINEEGTEVYNERKLVYKLVEYISLNQSVNIQKSNEAIDSKVEEYLQKEIPNLIPEYKKRLANIVKDKIFGYDIIQKYIDDEDISDIRIVQYNDIYVKSKGVWVKAQEQFKNIDEFEDFVRYVVLKNGSTINYESPVVVVSDKKNNLRIEAGIPPANVEGPSVCFRIHRMSKNLSLENLMIKHNMFNGEIYNFLLKAIDNKKNIIICGKGGSGKTTLLRALINKIPKEVSISTNEETAELYLQNRNVIQREVVSRKNVDTSIDLERLTRHSLVMANDVIIIGELKGKEANTFFDAISTGHVGYATVHTDSAVSIIDRIIVLIKKDIRAQGYSEQFLKQFLARTIDYVVYMKDYRINEITEIKVDDISKNIIMENKFSIQTIPESLQKTFVISKNNVGYTNNIKR